MACGTRPASSRNSKTNNSSSIGVPKSAPATAGRPIADGRVFVTDRLVEPKQVERVHCFDWKTGHELWTHVYDCRYSGVGYEAGPRAAVTIDDGRAYALGAMGNLHCLDAAKGTRAVEKRSAQGISNSDADLGHRRGAAGRWPLVIVQVGGEKACIVAFDKVTGDEKWKSLDDRASYSAPIIIQQAGRRVLVCWTGDNIAGLDPATGKVFWRHPFKPSRMVLNVATPVVHDDRLFLTAFYDGSLMLRLDQKKLAVEEIWQQSRPRRANDQGPAIDHQHALFRRPECLRRR